MYGSPRILADLREDGETISAKTVAKLMAANAIVGISPRKFTPTTTVADLGAPQIPDLVCRDFDRGRLDAVWMSDITYLDTDEGWLYLCAVRDGCSRRVLGWAIDNHLPTNLVEQALRMAHTMRGDLPDQVIFHADRGCTPRPSSPPLPPTSVWPSQSAGPGCAGTTPGPSRSGRPWKTEYYDRHDWTTKTEAHQGVGNWIEDRYNRRRRHSALNMLSPVAFEELMHQTPQAA